jgi:hypothetical protein
MERLRFGAMRAAPATADGGPRPAPHREGYPNEVVGRRTERVAAGRRRYTLRMPPPQPPSRRPDVESPVGEALAWASRIMAIGLAMFLPAVIGGWIDARLGTRVCGPAGLVLGFVAGLAWLVRIGTRRSDREGES